MNDWLSKIEAENRGYRKVMRLSDNETKSERMARVIRELVLYISQIELHLSEADVILERIDVCLSPDAKELTK